MKKADKTPKQRLVEAVYPDDLPTDIKTMRELGMSWRLMAAHVSMKGKVDVTHQSLRLWYGEPEKQTEAAS